MKKFLFSFFSASYILLIFYFGELSTANVVLVSIPLALYLLDDLTSGKTKDWATWLLPICLTLIVYDGMKYFAKSISANAHILEPYLLEKKIFGIPQGSSILNPTEFLQNYTHPILDVICGLAYILYIFVFLFIALYLFKNQRHLSFVSTWSFFTVNMMGYLTYYFYAQAPPWYITDFGLEASLDLSTPPSAAGAIRFDEVLGVDIMKNTYKNGSIVFGAMPSLHVAYPFLATLYAFHIKKFRIFTTCFYLLVVFSAVYLNHHYIIDTIVGSVYTYIAYDLCLRMAQSPWFYKHSPLKV